jgi:hypothetical protein
LPSPNDHIAALVANLIHWQRVFDSQRLLTLALNVSPVEESRTGTYRLSGRMLLEFGDQFGYGHAASPL